MATCKTVEVKGPSTNAPTMTSMDVSTSVNSATVTVTWRNDNNFGVTFDSVMEVDGNSTRKGMSIGANSTDTVVYNVSFDIQAGSNVDKTFCVDPENVEGS